MTPYRFSIWAEALPKEKTALMVTRNFNRFYFVEMVLAAILTLVACLMTGCGRDPARELRAASVPIHPLVHAVNDPMAEFPESFPLQVAVYWTSRDENVLAITHSLGAMGIPFFVTQDMERALRHRLVILYPSVDGRTLSDQEMNELRSHVEGGGSVFAVNVLAGSAKLLFGFKDVLPSRRRYRVTFTAGSDAILRYLNRPEELEAPLGSPQAGDIFWTNGYVADAHAAVLAQFEDGTAAVLANRLGKGTTYLAGVSYHDVVLRNQVNRDFNAERHYVNNFEPGADVWMLVLRAWYESSQPDAVRLDTMPAGKSSVLLLSHDIDWENSFHPALDFARVEKQHATSSTFFVQTKYVSDANSKAFFFGEDLADLRLISAEGFSIGSHSIIHSRGFNKFDLGSGEETFPSYQPRGTGFESSTGATVFGEVRVSKELLDGNLPGQNTTFFRAGHLRVPPSLPEALQRSGYEFDSSFTADDVLSNFPYRLPLGLDFDEDSGLYEFPVTFEDEESPLAGRIDQTLDVIRANAENGAVSVLLIHPNQTGDKLAAEEQLLQRLPSDVPAEDVLTFARFWRVRDRLQWKAVISRGSVVLAVRSAEAAHGLTVDFRRSIDRVDGGATLLPDLHRIVLPDLLANQPVIVNVHYAPSRLVVGPSERAESVPHGQQTGVCELSGSWVKLAVQK
jgi:hypothetical protein